MQCNAIILDTWYTTGATYTFYEIEKRKETIKEKTKIESRNSLEMLLLIATSRKPKLNILSYRYFVVRSYSWLYT